MKLSHKLLMVVLSLMAVIILVIALVLHFLTVPQVERIETAQQLEDVERVKSSLNNELNRLSFDAKDWGEWDDTYEYVANKNSEYEQSNLVDATLDHLNIDSLFIVDANHNFVWQQHSDIAQFSPSDRLWEALEEHQTQASVNHQEHLRRGIFHSDNGLIMYAWNPILTSESEGPVRGYIYFGKLLSDAFVQHLADSLKIDVDLSVSQTSDRSPSVVFISENLSQTTDYLKVSHAPEIALKITINQERPFHLQVVKGAKYALLITLLSGVLAFYMAYKVLHRSIVRPILLLQKQADKYGHDHKLSTLQQLNRDDELGELSVSFIRMAEKLGETYSRLEKERNEYEFSSYTDALTELRNRRYLEIYLGRDEVWEESLPWVFFALDLDFFKRVNDTYGHDIGDLVLQQFADLLRVTCRDQDIIVRTGGEEFVVVCRGATFTTAKKIAERLRLEISDYAFGDERTPFNLTCSIGFFSLYVDLNLEKDEFWKSILKISDLALYAAKENGRDMWIGLNSPSIDRLHIYPEDATQIVWYLEQKKLEMSCFPHKEIHWSSKS